MQRQFTGFGTERVAFGTDDIADIEGLESGKGLVTDLILFNIELNPPFAVLKLNEGRLSE
jgi:hypothetical protein